MNLPTRRIVIRIIGLLLISLIVVAPAGAQQPPDEIARLFADMSVEERVGQLFLIPFVGNDVSSGADITVLITQYKVGGVVLQASNSNFRNEATTPQEIARLTNALQAQTGANRKIPLFVAIDQEGDAWPYTRITGGVTPLPSQLSIGATWESDNAYAIGSIVGRELSAMGFNMLLGPVLDVLNDPRPTSKGDIGTRTFGGDPFWVSMLGQAYIRGVHEGSNQTMATVAKHFPGHGGSDRLPDNEVATVDKSLQELRRIELAPFFAVTAFGEGAEDSFASPANSANSDVTDAMMSSHIRYRGLQGDIRQFTAPISFDESGMTTLLTLPEFEPWRNQGGLIISDALGVLAVRRHYDPTLQSFPHRRIAREAFLAGNDVLILGQFDLRSIWSDQFENIKDTISYFQAEYRAKPDFAARVDRSAMRILRLKERLYPDFSSAPAPPKVDPDVALAVSGRGWEAANRIAEQSLTLLHPAPDELGERLPRSPAPHEKILVISDVRQVRECYQASCLPFEPLPLRAIEESMLRLYGPTRQVLAENVTSLSFGELKQVLVGSLAQVDQPPQTPPERAPDYRSPEEVTTLIQEADWIIFTALDWNPSRYSDSDALKLFLAQSFNSLNKRLVVFALNSPYYLDTTEINKLTAYFGLYSKTQPHLDVAVRALFDEVLFAGASPVTVEGINYELPEILAPDPIRSFPLQVQDVNDSNRQPPITVTIEVGPVLDHNGHWVPDGTSVELTAHYREGQMISLPTLHTLAGRVEAMISLPEYGVVELTARSGAAQSQPPQIVSIRADIAPTPTATPLPTPTPPPDPPTPPADAPPATVSPPQSPQLASPAELPASGSLPVTSNADQGMTLIDFLTALAGIIFTSTLALVSWQSAEQTLSATVRIVLVTMIGGLIGYLLFGIGWLRPDLWLIPSPPLFVQRFTLALIVLTAGILGNLIDQQIRD